MKNLILTLIIILPLTLWGQGWEQTYGENMDHVRGTSVQQTTDGGYIVSGHEVFVGILIKTDENGNELWFKNDLTQTCYSVQQTSDGGYIITGRSLDGLSDVCLLKTDENGNEQWNKTFGDGYLDGYSVQQTEDGGYIICCTTYSLELNGDTDVYLIKTDENGEEQWSKTFGGEGVDMGYSIQQTSDGGYIVCGTSLIKTDQNGEEQWSKTFSGKSVQQTTDGGYIITGTSNTNQGGYTDVLLIKTDENGNEQWNKIFEDGKRSGTDNSVQQTTDGGYIITGTSNTNQGGYTDVLLIKTDENGNDLWTKTFGGSLIDYGYSVQQTTDGGYIIVGSSQDNYTNERVYLVKTDDQGNITSTFEIPLPNPNRKLEKTVNLIGQEIKSQTNTPIIEIFDDGTVEKKIIVE